MSSIELPTPFEPYSSSSSSSSSKATCTLDGLADAGNYLGRLDKVLDGFNDKIADYPAASRFHQWDGKNLLEVKEFVRHIHNANRQGLVLDVISEFQSQIVCNKDEKVIELFRKGINQADYNDANIIIDLEPEFQIKGVIDFGDSVYSWRVLDISVAMAYGLVSAYGKRGYSVSSAASLLRGFHSVYPLLAIERKYLVLLMACRLVTSVTLGAYSYQQNPENEYLLLHAEPAWNALEFLWGWKDPSSDKEDDVDQIRKEQLERQALIHKRMNYLFDIACEKGDGKNCSDICITDDEFVKLTDEEFEKRFPK